MENNSKVAIVTGASSGIGYATSLMLSKAGIRVASKFIEASKNMERLQSEDVANAILYAIQAPNHVNVNEVLLRPTAQERWW